MVETRRAAAPLAAFLAFGVFWGGWAVLVPEVQRAVGASKGELGLALLAVGAGSVPAMVAVRGLLRRHAQRLLPLSLLALAGTVLLPGLAGSVPALAGALLAVGACSGVCDVAINAEASAIEAETGRPLMGLAHGLYSVGVMVGAVASGLLRQAELGRVPLLSVLAAGLLAAAAANRARPPHEQDAVAAPPRARIALPLVLLGAACATAFVVESGIETWSALFLQRDLGAGPAASSAGPAAFGAAMASGRLLGHRLTRRLPDAALLAGGGLLAAAGLLVAAAAQSLPLAAAGCFLGGAGISVAAPILFSAAGRGASGHERASAVATATTIGYLGFLAGPPLVGGMAQAAGLRVAFAALAGLAIVVAAAVPRLALGRAQAAARTT